MSRRHGSWLTMASLQNRLALLPFSARLGKRGSGARSSRTARGASGMGARATLWRTSSCGLWEPGARAAGSSDEDRGNGGIQRMNCYLCLVETGCASRAAVAVCQHCGAGMCGAHLRELSTTPVAGLAGTPRSVLLCCRCASSPVAPAARPMSKHQETQQGESSRSGWRWRGRHRRNVELPKPAEAVAAVERFLNRQHHG